jgi:maltoporin
MIRTAAVVLLLVPASALAEPEADEPAVQTEEKVESASPYGFGSYGRVGVGTDLRGSTPESVSVVQHGSRVVEPSYVELDMYYETKTSDSVKVDTVATLAFQDNLFHYTGEFDTKLALRNLYAQATVRDAISLWIGSRMYRGDDIFLLDYWPLDDVNTIGGGVGYRRDRLSVEAHAGANRLADEFQLQMVDVPAPEFGAETITQLDRQRFLASTKASYRFFGDGVGPSAKAKLFAEVQTLPAGELRREDQTIEQLPEDFGWSIGGQLGAWGFGPRNSHANLFVRFSQGLTAHDELSIPFGFDPSKKTFPDSSELVLGWSGNYEFAYGGALVGGYLRRFIDADTNDDMDDGWEYIADVRPYAALTNTLQGAVDVSYQKRYPRGVSPSSLMAVEPSVFQIAPMAVYSPFGRGSYSRPQFRLIYRAANINEDARDLYASEDARRARPWVHFLGMQVEWWFNSTYR